MREVHFKEVMTALPRKPLLGGERIGESCSHDLIFIDRTLISKIVVSIALDIYTVVHQRIMKLHVV